MIRQASANSGRRDDVYRRVRLSTPMLMPRGKWRCGRYIASEDGIVIHAFGESLRIAAMAR